MQNTTNLQLEIMEGGDPVDKDPINRNMIIIDAALGDMTAITVEETEEML